MILGSRLNIRQISYNYHSFARNAYKVMIDIDQAELDKPTLSIDQKIHANLRDALNAILAVEYLPSREHNKYLEWCKERRSKYPVVL